MNVLLIVIYDELIVTKQHHGVGVEIEGDDDAQQQTTAHSTTFETTVGENYEKEDSFTPNSSSKQHQHGNSVLYFCKETYPSRLFSKDLLVTNNTTEQQMNSETLNKDLIKGLENSIVIQFDPTARNFLTAIHLDKNDELHDDGDIKRQSFCRLQNIMGNNINLRVAYDIVGKDSEAQIILKQRKETPGAGRYCVARPVSSQTRSIDGDSSCSSSKVFGYVAHVEDNIQKIEDMSDIIPLSPTPLLSITLQRILPHVLPCWKSTNQPISILLRTCLKRQLVGRIIVCCDSYDATNDCNRNTVITLAVPNVCGNSTDPKLNHVYYQVLNVLPYMSVQGFGSERRKFESKHGCGNLFMILPSTLITFATIENIGKSDEELSTTPCLSEVKDHGDEINIGLGRKQDNVRLHQKLKKKISKVKSKTRLSITAKILLKTIETVRFHANLQSTNNLRDKSIDSKDFISLSRSFLLSGPPGCGKTFAVRTAVDESNRISHGYQRKDTIENHSLIKGPSNGKNTFLLSIRGSELLSLGSSIADAALSLQKYFSDAVSFSSRHPNNVSVIFMDEFDALISSDIVGSMLALLLDKVSTTRSINEKSLNSGSTSKYNYDNELNVLGNRTSEWNKIIVIAATNRIDSVPSFLRRPGRFDHELCVPPPNSRQRFEILKSILEPLREIETSSSFLKPEFPKEGGKYSVLTSNSLSFPGDEQFQNTNMTNNDDKSSSIPSLVNDTNLTAIADLCVGYVAADLMSLVRRAALLAAVDNGDGKITIKLLKKAMLDVGASSLRQATFSAPPTTKWEDIIGDPGGAKTALRRAIEWPRTRKKEFEMLGLVPPRGILLHGPPGCAKTTLARAAAGAAGIAFISYSPADVYATSYVGEAEAVIRRAFTLARSASPCILFFDEIDSILGSNSQSSSGHGMGEESGRGGSAEARVLSTFLNEMDGVDGSAVDGVLVLGATNRPSAIDSALLRPGRFDNVIHVPPPDRTGRHDILKSHCDKWERSALFYHKGPRKLQYCKIDTEFLASDEISGSMTGAEIVGACHEASMLALREVLFDSGPEDIIQNDISKINLPQVNQWHLEKALKNVKPLLSNENVMLKYTDFNNG